MIKNIKRISLCFGFAIIIIGIAISAFCLIEYSFEGGILPSIIVLLISGVLACGTYFILNKNTSSHKTEQSQTLTESTQESHLSKQTTVKLIIVSISFLIIVATTIFLFILYITPMMKYNTADKLLKERRYEEAYSIYVELDDYKDSYQKRADSFAGYLYKTALSQGKYNMAFEMLNEELCNPNTSYEYRYSYTYNNVISNLPSLNIKANNYETYYNELCIILNENPTFDYWDDSYGNSRNSQLMYYLLSNLPLEYKDVSNLIMIFTDLKSGEIHPINDYMKTNRSFLFTLWDYGFVREFSTNDNNIKDYLVGVWSTDFSDDIPFDDEITLEFHYETKEKEKIVFNSTGLATPNITHRYYNVENHILIYTNGDKTLCNVFKFSFDEEDPNILFVYCYEDGKTLKFHRTM